MAFCWLICNDNNSDKAQKKMWANSLLNQRRQESRYEMLIVWLSGNWWQFPADVENRPAQWYQGYCSCPIWLTADIADLPKTLILKRGGVGRGEDDNKVGQAFNSDSVGITKGERTQTVVFRIDSV